MASLLKRDPTNLIPFDESEWHLAVERGGARLTYGGREVKSPLAARQVLDAATGIGIVG